MTGLLGSHWRAGRKVGRTIYAVVGVQPADEDVLIGVMDTPALADRVVRDHNHAVDAALQAERTP